MSHKTTTLAAAGVLSLIVLANDKVAGAAWIVTGDIATNRLVSLIDAPGFTYTYRAATNDFIDAQNVVWTYRELVWFADGTGFCVLSNKAKFQFWDGGFSLPGPKPARAGTPSRVLRGRQ